MQIKQEHPANLKSPRLVRRTEIVRLRVWKANFGGPPILRPDTMENKVCCRTQTDEERLISTVLAAKQRADLMTHEVAGAVWVPTHQGADSQAVADLMTHEVAGAVWVPTHQR
eukprot:4380138-Amphidinium_carterae.1